VPREAVPYRNVTNVGRVAIQSPQTLRARSGTERADAPTVSYTLLARTVCAVHRLSNTEQSAVVRLSVPVR